MSTEYVPVKPGVLKKGDVVYEVVQYAQDRYKYNEGKVLAVLGDKVAHVRLVGANKTAKIPLKNLAMGAGLYEARTDPSSTRESRLAKYSNGGVVKQGPVVEYKVTLTDAVKAAEVKVEPKTEPEVVTGVVAKPAAIEGVTPATSTLTGMDEFNAWLSIGVDFLPTLEKRISDRQVELDNADTALEQLRLSQKERLEEAERKLVELRESFETERLEFQKIYDAKQGQLHGWQHIYSLLRPLTDTKP